MPRRRSDATPLEGSPFDQLHKDVGDAVADNDPEKLGIALVSRSTEIGRFDADEREQLTSLVQEAIRLNQVEMFECFAANGMADFDWWEDVLRSDRRHDFLHIVGKYDLDMNQEDGYKFEPSWWSCISDDSISTLELVLACDKVDLAYSRGFRHKTALGYAAYHCQLDSFRLLVKAGADPHQSWALHLVAGKHWLDHEWIEGDLDGEGIAIKVLKFLLDEMHMDINQTINKNEWPRRAKAAFFSTVLYWAFARKSPCVIRFLLENGANPYLRNGDSCRSVFEFAEIVEYDEGIEILQEWLRGRTEN